MTRALVTTAVFPLFSEVTEESRMTVRGEGLIFIFSLRGSVVAQFFSSSFYTSSSLQLTWTCVSANTDIFFFLQIFL